MIYTAIHETRSASGIESNTVLKTPMEATEDAGSALRHDILVYISTKITKIKIILQRYCPILSLCKEWLYVMKYPHRERIIKMREDKWFS